MGDELSAAKLHLPALPVAYQAWRESELGRTTDRLEEQAIFALAGAVDGRQVLDVGCGDGALSVALARRGGDVTGLDLDPRMLAAAGERARQVRLPGRFVAADAVRLPFPDGTFDLVVAVTVLCFIPGGERAVSEMARVLRPGGRLVIGELGRFSLWAAKRRLAGWLGSKIWAAATFRSPRALIGLVEGAALDVTDARGAIYYPPCGICARLSAPIDAWLGRRILFGAAFLIVAAIKDVRSRPPTEPPG